MYDNICLLILGILRVTVVFMGQKTQTMIPPLCFNAVGWFSKMLIYSKKKPHRQWKSLPTLNKERSHFSSGYCRTLPPEEKKDQWELGGTRLDLKPSPDES
jgi:hypothetical protein